MEASLISLIKDPVAQNLISKFSHFSDDDINVFVNFNDPRLTNRYLVAKKLHDGSRLEADHGSMFYEIMDKIIQDYDDLSIPNLNKIMLKEVEKYNELKLESNRNVFHNEITKFEKLLNQYLVLNVFSTSTKKWEELILSPLSQLESNKILRTDNVLYVKVLTLQETFIALMDGQIKANSYLKLIDKFLQHVKFDSNGVKKIRELFLENLTFDKAQNLPNPEVNTIFKMLFERHKFDADKYELRQFKDIDDMLKSIQSN